MSRFQHTQRSATLRHLLGATVAVTLGLAAAMPISSAAAHEYKVGAITIAHPWSRATPPGAATGAGYLGLTNQGADADRLVEASSPVAAKVEVHQMSVEGGIMKMGAVEGGLEVPAGGSVALEPGGYHLMLTGLTRPLVEGERIPLKLVFDKAGPVEVELAVDKIGAKAPTAGAPAAEAGAHQHHK
jgi:copper(I)-binding protein